MKIIDFEAHFYTETYLKHLRARKDPPREEVGEKSNRMWFRPNLAIPRSFVLEDKLADLGGKRIEAMDAAGIDVQVLSLCIPGCEQFEASEGAALVRQVNDELAEAVKKSPERFMGLAALAPQDPVEAANELERAVKKLGLHGALINSNVRGEYLDDQKYWVIFEKAASLDVPIYLHPGPPSPSIEKPFLDYGYALAGAPFGYGAEAALHIMRLIYSGLFDKYPQLKMVIGHLGEALPYWLSRIDFYWRKPWVDREQAPKIIKKPSDCIKTNFIITTSGMSYLPAFMCAYLALGADSIAFGTDYPMEDSREAVGWMEAVPVCDTDREKICHLNAEKVLKLS